MRGWGHLDQYGEGRYDVHPAPARLDRPFGAKAGHKETLKSFDGSQYGGAPLLGLKGLVVRPTAIQSARR